MFIFIYLFYIGTFFLKLNVSDTYKLRNKKQPLYSQRTNFIRSNVISETACRYFPNIVTEKENSYELLCLTCNIYYKLHITKHS